MARPRQFALVLLCGNYCRVVRCEARRLRVVRDREYRNADLEPRGGTRRNNLER